MASSSSRQRGILRSRDDPLVGVDRMDLEDVVGEDVLDKEVDEEDLFVSREDVDD